MVVGPCKITISLAGIDSLKDKRSVLKPLLTRVRHEFNVAAAETGDQDSWGSGEIGLVAVAADQAYVDGLLQKAVSWIEQSWLDVELLDYQIEILHV